MSNYNYVEIKKKYKQNFIIELNKIGYCPPEIQSNILFLKNTIIAVDTIKPLNKSGNAWKPGRDRMELSEIDLQINKIKSKLNKIDSNNESTISDQIVDLIRGDNVLNIIVPFIYYKGAWDNKYRDIIIRLCNKIFLKFGEKFRSVIIEKCKEEFKGPINEDDDDDIILYNTKKRSGSILFMKGLLSVNIISNDFILECIKKLLECEKDNIDDKYASLNHYGCVHASELMKETFDVMDKSVLLEHIMFIRNVYDTKKLSGSTKNKLENAFSVLKS